MPCVISVSHVCSVTLDCVKYPLTLPWRLADAARTVPSLGWRGGGVAKTWPPVRYADVRILPVGASRFVWQPLQSAAALTRYEPRPNIASWEESDGAGTSASGSIARPRST